MPKIVECPNCHKRVTYKNLIERLGGMCNIRGNGLRVLQCSCGNVIKLNYYTPTKNTAFFVVEENY